MKLSFTRTERGREKDIVIKVKMSQNLKEIQMAIEKERGED